MSKPQTYDQSPAKTERIVPDRDVIPSDPVDLDYNATTPMDPRVLAAMTPWFLTPSNSGSRTHAYGRRAKEAVEQAVGLGEAARLAGGEWQSRRAAALKIREQLLRDLRAVEHRINGDPTRCQPHVLNISFRGIDSEALMLALRDKIALSNGSACTSSSYKPSHVLVAMGLDLGRICNTVRKS